MIILRPAAERGQARYDWAQSRHGSSFGGYHDPRHTGVSNLRVVNDDTVAPGGGFATHGHRDTENVTYVLSGALEHRDSLGDGSVIRPGDVQRMSAGTGVLHSEYNPSEGEPVHLLEIRLRPTRQGARPGCAQKHFPAAARRGRLVLLSRPTGARGPSPPLGRGSCTGRCWRRESP
jgi:redox-sensitive bicupin YhaK (pirin superfamily)